jgi:hypothetical protein
LSSSIESLVDVRGDSLYKLIQERVTCDCHELYAESVSDILCFACKKIQDVLTELDEHGYVHPAFNDNPKRRLKSLGFKVNEQ